MNFDEISKKIEESSVFRPSVLLTLGTIIFLVLSSHVPSLISTLAIALSLGAFAAGDILGYKHFKAQPQIPSGFMRKASMLLFVGSLAALYFNFFTAGGIPLLNSSIRQFLHPVLTSLSFLLVPASAVLISTIDAKDKYARLKTAGIIFFTATMMALLGYRTEVLAAIIIGMITAYYCHIFSLKEVLAFAIAALVAGGGMTYMRNGFGETSRATTTVAAFDFLMDNTGLAGLTKGYAQFADIVKLFTETPTLGGRNLVAMIVGSRPAVSITSTLFGPAFADFGIFALLEFFFIGLLSGAACKAAETRHGLYSAGYAIIITFLLLGIETGITDLIIWIYFLGIAGYYAFTQLKVHEKHK